jgi:hypothetical protein
MDADGRYSLPATLHWQVDWQTVAGRSRVMNRSLARTRPFLNQRCPRMRRPRLSPNKDGRSSSSRDLRIEFLLGLFTGVHSTEDIAISKSHRHRIQEPWNLESWLCSREAAYVSRTLADSSGVMHLMSSPKRSPNRFPTAKARQGYSKAEKFANR